MLFAQLLLAAASDPNYLKQILGQGYKMHILPWTPVNIFLEVLCQSQQTTYFFQSFAKVVMFKVKITQHLGVKINYACLMSYTTF